MQTTQPPLCFDDTETAFRSQPDDALKRAAWLFRIMRHGWLVRLGSFVAPLALRWHLPVEGLIRRTVFQHFCGGESLSEAGETAARLSRFSVGTALDYGVEAAAGEESYDATARECLRAIDFAAGRLDIPFVSLKITGLGRFGLLEKLHAGEVPDAGETAEWERSRGRVYAICARASAARTAVLIDAEESWIQGPVDRLAMDMMKQFNRESVVVFNTYQLYLKDRATALQGAWKHAAEEGYLLGAKLVRGAYLEKEAARARARGYAVPLQSSKQDTDQAFDEAIRFCFDRLESISVLIGTHNEQSCLLAAALLDEKGLPRRHPHVHFSQLYGMSDHITFNLAAAGYAASKYLPYGPVREVLPYLIRRARENTAISGQLGREESLLRRELVRRNL